jgi:hypothetical protein
VTFLLFSHSYRHAKCINFIVPLHLQGENKGFSKSLSSERHILHSGIPPLVRDVSLITSGAIISLPLGMMTLVARLLLFGKKIPSYSLTPCSI